MAILGEFALQRITGDKSVHTSYNTPPASHSENVEQQNVYDITFLFAQLVVKVCTVQCASVWDSKCPHLVQFGGAVQA